MELNTATTLFRIIRSGSPLVLLTGFSLSVLAAPTQNTEQWQVEGVVALSTTGHLTKPDQHPLRNRHPDRTRTLKSMVIVKGHENPDLLQHVPSKGNPPVQLPNIPDPTSAILSASLAEPKSPSVDVVFIPQIGSTVTGMRLIGGF